MKKDFGLDRKSDIFADKNGNLFAGPTKRRTGAMKDLGINRFRKY